MRSGFQSGLHKYLICKWLHSIITCNIVTQYYMGYLEICCFQVEIMNNFLCIINTDIFTIKMKVILLPITLN